MKNRSPIAVVLLSFITLGIYAWYWSVKTKTEMNSHGTNIPTAWIWLIPIVGQAWWYWKYSEGVEHITGGKLSTILTFVLLFVVGPIGMAIIQDAFNKVTAVPTEAPAFSATPTNLSA
jgi:hypothetical protein